MNFGFHMSCPHVLPTLVIIQKPTISLTGLECKFVTLCSLPCRKGTPAQIHRLSVSGLNQTLVPS
jgi:hypothetical protein